MVRLQLAAPFLAALFGAALPAQDGPPKLEQPPGLQLILAKDLAADANFLASDELQGRLTGSPGQELAADYILQHFKSLGLEPLGDREPSGDGRVYRQRYTVTRLSLDLQASGVTLGVGAQAREFGRGFAVIPPRKHATEAVEVLGEFVYAGLVNTRRFKKGVQLEDWKDKIPVFVIDLPKNPPRFGIERQMGMGMFLVASLKRRADRLAKLGAKVALFCVLDNDSSVSNMLTYCAIAPGQDMMSKKGSTGMGRMMQMLGASVPTIYLSRRVSLAILKATGLTAETAGEAQDPAAIAKLKGVAGRVRITIDRDPKARVSNVVAVIRGSDPLLGREAILYSAHMDHVGLRLDGDAYNGADDNASGTAGLMAIARAYAGLKTPPKRTIIFLAVSGEELGLWGSAYHAANPTWPLVDIVANINTDMIGRNGPESGPMDIAVTPSFRHAKFSTLVRDAARVGEQMGISFTRGDKYYARSDHYNFAKVGIPVVFFCNGEHEDYHQVSDHSDKLDTAKMERITRLAYWTGYLVAQGEERPKELGRSAGWLAVETGK